MLTFPITLTFDEIAALDGAAEAFLWDDSQDETLAELIASFSTAYWAAERLGEYLKDIGYEVTEDDGVTVRTEAALRTANALFEQVRDEFDDEACPRLTVVRGGQEGTATPTWALFELLGDDYVDYCGSQPSFLTGLLIDTIAANERAAASVA